MSDPDDEPRLGEIQQGVAQLTVSHITWGVVGLDSNNVAVGPNVFPVGVRIHNIGDATATDLTAAFAFTTANALIAIDSPSAVTFPSLAAGAQADVYFNVRVARATAAYNTSRRFEVTVSGTGFATASSPTPREIYVEKLVSQNRNQIVNISGPTSVNTGETHTYVLDASTATGGYEQNETFLTFPTSFFQVVSTAATYTAPAGATNDKIYADACGWDPLPTSLTYRDCIGPTNFPGGKAGGTIQLTYVLKVVGGGTANVTAGIYDFSGSSYHYNSDFGAMSITVVATAVPVATDDSHTTAEDATLTINAPGVLGNDSHPGGLPFTAVQVSQAAHGTATLASDGSFVYTPDAHYNGPDSFTYKANDGTSDSSVATVSIGVTSVNDPPDASNDSATVARDASAAPVNVLANDTSAPDSGETLTISSVTQPASGAVVITGGGSGLTFQPTAGFTGITTFTYTISDGNGGNDTATVTMTVTSPNTPPDAVDDSDTVAEDAIATAIAVLGNDSDGNGDTLTITSVTQAANGAVVITGGGTGLTFQPAANFHGPTTFTYTISDGNGGTDTATVTVAVTPVNDPPTAVDNTQTVAEDAGATAIAVLGNDADVDGDTLTITSVTQPASGAVVITGGGTGLTFQPATNFHGIRAFTYTISDGNGGTATATVTVTVTSVNDPPSATDDAQTVTEDADPAAITVLGNDSDVDGDTLTITSVTQPATGAVVITGGGTGLTFQPSVNFHGFRTFTYTISDGNGGTATATVTVTVTPVNDPPSAVDNTQTVAEDAGATAIAVLGNDSDVDGDTLTITSVTQPASGAVVITGGGTGLTFQPSLNFHGTRTFTYTISDGNGGTATATVTVTVTPVNDPPSAVNDAETVVEDADPTAIAVLANDSDIEGNTLTITSVTQPANGAVVITGSGTGLTFQPSPNFAGTTSFTYTISDGNGGTATATVTMTVTPVNDPPSAVDNTQTVAEDAGATAFDVLGNDSDVDGDTLTIASVTQPVNGAVVITGGGTGLTFQPSLHFHGATSFTYAISDGNGGTATATVTVTVTPVNDPPSAVDDTHTVAEDAAATAIAVLGNDSDLDGNTLTITSATQPAAGTVSLTGGGTGLTFQPSPDVHGTTTFTYTISDGNGGTATATVTVTVTPVNDPPSAVNDAETVAEDADPTAIAVLANDSDIEGNTLAITSVTQPANGAVVITGSGTGLTFQPSPHFAGATSFTYTISDGNGGTATATVMVTVTAVNDPPSAVDDTETVAEDAGPTTIAVLDNDSDIEGNALAITSVTQPANGAVVITGGGTGLTFQPSLHFHGATSFTYAISDGNGGTATATVTVTVTPVNDPPSAVDDAHTVAEDAAATAFDVLGNDADVDGDTLTITSVTQPANGAVAITGAGTGLTFQPGSNFHGTTAFTYAVSDGNGGTATATVTVTVTSVNDPPTAAADAVTVAEDADATPIDVLVNDSDLDEDTLSVASVDQPAGGTVVITGGGTGLTFQPHPNVHGTVTFTYTVSDGNGGTDTVVVSVTVTPVNDPPSAMSDAATTAEGAVAGAIDVLTNDTDVDGDALTITSVTQPAGGVVVLTGGGTGLTFQPHPGFHGTTTFTYTISDGSERTATATVTVEVTASPLPDRDADGVPDSADNCPDDANPDQKDGDNSGRGDACTTGFNDNLHVSGGGCQVGGGGGPSAALIVLLAGLAATMRRRRHRVALAGLLVLAVAPAARADDLEPRNFSVERFHLAPDRNGLFNVDWAEHPGGHAIDAALVVGLVDDPLVVYREDQNNDRMVVGALVGTRATANLVGSIALRRAIAIGADLPLVIYQDRPSTGQIAPSGLESLSSFGLGNLRVTPKLTLLTHENHGIGLAVLGAITLPTESKGDAYFGDHGFSISPTLALSKRSGPWRTGVNVGYLARQEARLLDLVVDDEVFLRAGVGYDLGGRKAPVSIDMTMSAATAVADFGGRLNINHLEALLGATYQADPQFQLFGGAGTGLAHGFGTPDARFLLGVRLTRGGPEPRKPVERDRDRDGLLDLADKCPAAPEDRDGFRDDDGCPDPDNDGDGAADVADKCPAEIEDKDSFLDDDGCPDPDNDNDGVLDVADSCPMEPGPQPSKGCPDPDGDGDTVVDRLDNCPAEQGPVDNAGCPKQQMVKLGDDKLEIIESVYFKLDKAIIEERSHALLDNVAAVIASHPQLVIQVEGHTDSQGDDVHNLDLSQRRAEAVVDYLVKKGTARPQLRAEGFGENKPIADNKTKQGRAQNRRVVFTIVGTSTIENKQQGADDSTKEK